MGDKFSAPDAYLFTVLSWAPHLKISLDKWPTLGAYLGRVGARPQVQAALKAEGLIK
jgi:glutathione S-transferase